MKSTIARSSASSLICPWPTTTRASGTSRVTQVADRVDRLDAVVDEVDLPAARQLAADGARDDRPGRSLTTLVWIDRRSFGGVSMIDMSRMPTSDMLSVRGIGVARHRQHVDLAPQLLDPLLVRDAEPLLLVDDQQAEVAELDVLRQQAVRADDDVDLAGGQVREDLRSARPRDRNRLTMSMRTGNRRSARVSVFRCWNASTVVGARTATCLPSITALNAARIATSVLP